MYYPDNYYHHGRYLNHYPQPFHPYAHWGNVPPNPYPQFQNSYHGYIGGKPITNQFPTPVSYSNPNPYPSPYSNPYPNGAQSIMTQFKSEDGKIDFNKMMNTAGQMVGAVNQLSSIVKGVSQVFKGV